MIVRCVNTLFLFTLRFLINVVISASLKSSEEVNAVASTGPAAGAAVYEYTTQNKQMRHDELFRLYLVFQEMRIAGVQVPCCAMLCCAVLCCAVLCCAVLCCAVQSYELSSCA
jgi:hypothetical protein